MRSKSLSNLVRFVCYILLLLALGMPQQARAQQIIYPTYVVATGDTLSTIAYKFHTDVNALITANNIENPNVLNVGTELSIPSFPGVSGRLTIQVASLGDTIASMSDRFGISPVDLIAINKITSPQQLFIGSELIVPIQGELEATASTVPELDNQPVWETALKLNTTPWQLILKNKRDSAWALPEKYALSQPASGDPQVETKPPYTISLGHLPAAQGNTVSIVIKSQKDLQVSGGLDQQPIQFAQTEPGTYAGLMAINAMDSPGLKNLTLRINDGDQTLFSTEQYLLIKQQVFSSTLHLEVDPSQITQETIEAEAASTRPLITSFDPQKYWTGTFRFPTDDACVRAWYGGSRVYNHTYNYYHTGVDFGICADNLNIYAPADGVIAATGQSAIKGNYTIINHGLGVYTGYFHQAEIKVQQGERVTPGQLIGIVGNTGRSTGAHLHWEMWVNGISVDPLIWTESSYP